ncbi:hypothetical protein NMK34_00005 [Micromonospora sp. BRA006-A]|uniref:hypothetical protein n=1 Tax=Micromonospora sp. BRA006-A TaxID=2962860 RepID=UPI00296E4423|nr:hypothetical protein [Micromonospora sp. BRA006-A]MDW3844989.1 hypothetical protein [Micromonospora sp. BRA006-A]
MSPYHVPAWRYVDALDGSTLETCHDPPVNLDLDAAQKATSIQGTTNGDRRHGGSTPSLRRGDTPKYLNAVNAKPKGGTAITSGCFDCRLGGRLPSIGESLGEPFMI